MRKFNLELASEKTRLLEFGPPMPSTNGSGVEKGNRRPSTSSLYAYLREEEEQ